MKRIVALLFVALVLGFSLRVQAELFNRGTDTLGNRLIYDSDLNITWYDYTNERYFWDEQNLWAYSLEVEFEGTIYDNWRVPTTVDGPYVYGYDGTTSGGYNITSSEMGHLFYAELGNKGYVDTSGNLQTGYGLTNTGDFQHLYGSYWTSGENGSDPWYGDGWYFSTSSGKQATLRKDHDLYAIAVRDGDVATVVPEPISSILFVIGGTLLAGRRFLRRKA